MTAVWAATNTLREALAIGWPEGDHAEPNAFTEALDALALVEAALAAAERVLANQILVRYDNAADPMFDLTAALRAVREGK